jgi:sugar lactone lactonase YvrE
MVAGSGSYGFSGNKGQASAARLANPSGIAVSDSGEIFIADTENHRIRKVSFSGAIETVARTGSPGFIGGRRAATGARLSNPRGLALDGKGRLYIADSGHHRIRAIDPDGTISTIAGTGRRGFVGDDGPATASQLARPHAVAVDALGDVYIADTGNHRIRKVSNKIITTVAGGSRIGFAGDDGPAYLAALNTPAGIAVDMFGVVYIADTRNHRVRRVDLDGSITTIMGTGHDSYGRDGGPATSASLRLPEGVAVGRRGGYMLLTPATMSFAGSTHRALRRLSQVRARQAVSEMAGVRIGHCSILPQICGWICGARSTSRIPRIAASGSFAHRRR